MITSQTDDIDRLSHKRPLAYHELRDIIDLSLWAGQMLLQHGATSQRVEESVHRIGTGLGCDWLDILVSPNVITITASSGSEFRTKLRRVTSLGVDLGKVTALNDLSRRIISGEVDHFQARTELKKIDQMPRSYNRWLVVIMVGLACAAFSRLFGGDWIIFGITFGASAVAMFLRQELTQRYFNPLLVVVTCAFVAGCLASTAGLFKLSNQSEIALAAAVLLLVPGVPLINAAQDLIRGHLVTGITRGVTGLLISLAIALGLLLAISLTGVSL
ncbi:MAG: threonine/serine exporter family protein [Ardenticatenaceae bacterium]|nr:threonine/serine exporter family protein [Ardenticatenaceae bacterium]